MTNWSGVYSGKAGQDARMETLRLSCEKCGGLQDECICPEEEIGGTMSEQQVLPELDVTDEEHQRAKRDTSECFQRMGHVILCRERQLLSALASLAQSEAERERLQGRITISCGRQESFKRRAQQAETELARERERHQTARQLLREYRESHINSRRPCVDSAACSTCQEGIALLEPAPVATGEETP